MYQLERIIQNRMHAVGLCLLSGFLGSVIGLVYGWSLIFDRVWFLLWFCGAVGFGILRVKEWYTERATALQADSAARTGQPSTTLELSRVQPGVTGGASAQARSQDRPAGERANS